MKAAILCACVALSVGACKKSTGTGGGGGGGGGGWLVGSSGLMVNVSETGNTKGYNLASTENLNAIACRYSGEAWVVGNHGTLLYTDDAGTTWTPENIPTTADLRALATQNAGPVFVGGQGVFLTSSDTGAHWSAIASASNFRSIAAAQDGTTVLALADDGTLFSFENQQLVQRGSFPGAHVVAVTPDGQTAVLAGDSMIARSTNAGQTWSAVAGADSASFDDVQLDETGRATAVGTSGAVAHVGADGSLVMQQIGNVNLHAIHISDDGEAEGLGFAAGDLGATFMTHDGGTTWSVGPVLGRTVLSVDEIGDALGHR